MEVKRGDTPQPLHHSPPPLHTDKATGAFVGHKVQKLPGSAVQKFLIFLSEKANFKSGLTSLIGKVSSNWYGYLLMKQNPLERGHRDMSASIDSNPALKQEVQEYIQQQLAYHELTGQVKPEQFLTTASGQPCTLAAVHAALSMFSGDAQGVTALAVVYDGPCASLPGIATEAIAADLTEHHGIPAGEVAEVMKKNPEFCDLQAVAVCCNYASTDELWQEVLKTDQNVSLLPAAQQGQLLERLAAQMPARAGDPMELAKAYLAGNGNTISVHSLTTFKKYPKSHLQFQEAVKSGDFSELKELKLFEVSRLEKAQLVDMYTSKMQQAGMNSLLARDMVSNFMDHQRTTPLPDLHASLKHQYSLAWQPTTSAKEERLHTFSDAPLEERCKSPGKPADTKAMAEQHGLDPSCVELLKNDPQFRRDDLSTSDIETALDVVLLKQQLASPLSAFKGKPLQVMSMLPDASRTQLERFARSELASLNPSEDELTENLKLLNSCVFAHQYETKLRDMLPARLLLPEAYDTLKLPLDSSKEDLSRMYKQMAIKYHPDKHAGKSFEDVRAAEEEFKNYIAVYERVKPFLDLSKEESAIFTGARYLEQ